MTIKTIILSTAALAFIAFSPVGRADEASKNTTREQKKETAVKPAPFVNYWAAQSWDVEGSAFWHAKETPASAQQKTADRTATAKKK